MPSAQDYPALAALLRDYFHQDCDSIAEEDEGLIEAYLRHAKPADIAALTNDIEQFVAQHPAHPYTAFEAYFSPEAMFYEPTDEGVIAWLDAVLDMLSAPHG